MISLVICSRDKPHADAAARHWQAVLGTTPGQIVNVVGAASMAAGYNQGLQAASGDIVVFAHDDVEVLSPDFIPRLQRHLKTCDVVGLAGTSRLIGPSWANAGPPHIFGQVLHRLHNKLVLVLYGTAAPLMIGMQAMDGLLLAFRRNVIDRLLWDATTFTAFHFYDLDITFRAHLAGYRLAVANDLHVLHASGGNYGDSWASQAQRFEQKFAGTLPSAIPHEGVGFAHVEVPSKAVAIEAMTPPHWSFPTLPQGTAP